MSEAERDGSIPGYITYAVPNFSIKPRLKDNLEIRLAVEEAITKSHREWRSIPETAFIVLRTIEKFL